MITKYLLGLTFLVSSAAKAAEVSGRLYWPELRRSVGFTVDTERGHYKYDFLAFINPRIVVSGLPASIDCDRISNIVENTGPGLPTRLYRAKDPVVVTFHVFDFPSDSEFEERLRKEVEIPSNVKLQNVGNLRVHSARLQFAWNNKSLSVMAGPQVTYDSEGLLNQILEGDGIKGEINRTGRGNSAVNILPLICDLRAKKVDLTLNIVGAQFSERVLAGPILRDHLVQVNANIHANRDLIDGGGRSNSKHDQVIRSAALLAFELANLGYDKSILQGNKFIVLYEDLFLLGPTRPSRWEDEDVDKLLQKLATVEFDGEDIEVSESVKIEAL